MSSITNNRILNFVNINYLCVTEHFFLNLHVQHALFIFMIQWNPNFSNLGTIE